MAIYEGTVYSDKKRRDGFSIVLKKKAGSNGDFTDEMFNKYVTANYALNLRLSKDGNTLIGINTSLTSQLKLEKQPTNDQLIGLTRTQMIEAFKNSFQNRITLKCELKSTVVANVQNLRMQVIKCNDDLSAIQMAFSYIGGKNANKRVYFDGTLNTNETAINGFALTLKKSKGSDGKYRSIFDKYTGSGYDIKMRLAIDSSTLYGVIGNGSLITITVAKGKTAKGTDAGSGGGNKPKPDAPNKLKRALNLANLYFNAKNYAKAKQDYEKIINLAPESEQGKSAKLQLDRIKLIAPNLF